MREREDTSKPETSPSRSARDGGQANESDNRANGSDEVRMLEVWHPWADSESWYQMCIIHDASHVVVGRGAAFRGRSRPSFAQRHRQKVQSSFADAFDLGSTLGVDHRGLQPGATGRTGNRSALVKTPTHSGSLSECWRPDSPRVSYAVAIVSSNKCPLAPGV
jgi:hypothetical protein